MKSLITPQKTNDETSLSREVSVVLPLSEIGKQISRARAHTNKTLEEVSKECGLSTVWISKLEKGKLENASLKSLAEVANVFKLKLSFSLIN